MTHVRPPGLRQGLAVVALLLLPMQAMAATYYVATTGNDSNAGSSSQPWKTIEKASNTVSAGDTVIISGGTYAEYVTCTGSAGTSGSPITFQAASGETVIIDATGKTHGLRCTKAYYTFDGIRFANSNNHGILYTSNVAGAVVKNCWAYGNQNIGINIDNPDNAVVENCVVYDNGNEGVRFGGNADGGVLSHCTIWGNTQDGVICSTSDVTITDCIITENGIWGVDTYGGDVVVDISTSCVWANGDGSYRTGKVEEGDGVLHQDPLLVDPSSDFRLASNSPCVGTGSSSSDMGYPWSSYGPEGNAAPVVDAGPSQSITLPTDSVFLPGTAEDDGNPDPPASLTTTWTKQSGSGTVTFASSSSPSTTATFSTSGTYVLRLTGDDSDRTAYHETTITVNPEPPNDPPVVDAGPDKFTVDPDDDIFIDATVTDDGHPNPPSTVTTTWTKQSGPGTVTFDDDSAVDTTATFSTTGTYVLRLTADDTYDTSYDEVTISYLTEPPPNSAPTVDAGSDQTVGQGSPASLDGTVSDDGLPSPPGSVTTTWSKTSGSGTVTFGDSSAVDTTATFSTDGTYVLRLTANDSDESSYDEVTITVTEFGAWQGFGADATGGEGGTEYFVTNLNNSGTGSLRAVASGNFGGSPRIIKFNVAGTINVDTKIYLTNGNITIMGSSAPGNGITINAAGTDRSGIGINSSNVIVENIRIRNSPFECLQIDGDDTIVVDHVSATGCGDGAIDVNGGAWGVGTYDITISNCLIANAVEGSRSHGHQISWFRNLFVITNRRQPKVALGGPDYDFINNYVTMWTNTGMHIEGGDGGINVIKNVFGPPSPGETWPVGLYADGGVNTDAVYTSGNIGGGGWDPNEVGNAGSKQVDETPPVAVTEIAASSVVSTVKANCGAKPTDSTDQAFINQAP